MLMVSTFLVLFEGTKGWEEGLDVLSCSNEEDFIEKVWNDPATLKFMERLNSTTDKYGCRHCPIYKV